MAGTIYVMRHGESVVNVEHRLTCRKFEGDLTNKGRQQAARAAAWLRDKQISAIRCSPFHRAVQTAQAAGEVLGLAVELDDDLREMDCGDLEDRTDADAWEAWAVIYRRWKAHDLEAAFPGGETYANARMRLMRALEWAAAQPGDVLLVTHGGITRTVLPYLCVNAAALQQVETLDNTGLVVLEPYDAGRYVCVSWNLAEHLVEAGHNGHTR